MSYDEDDAGLPEEEENLSGGEEEIEDGGFRLDEDDTEEDSERGF